MKKLIKLFGVCLAVTCMGSAIAEDHHHHHFAKDVDALGVNVLKVERDFNKRAGFTNHHDRLPEFMEYEPCPPHNEVWNFTPEEVDEVFNF